MRATSAVIAVLLVGALAAAAFVWSGAYNIAADDPHYGLTRSALETLRLRSVAARAESIEIPSDLQSLERLRRGAGNYDAMCAGCHLAPGAQASELGRGLYPAPPNLSRPLDLSAAQAFWVIKHGIKASGMPAWGKSMQDSHIWDLVAFLDKLPTLAPAQYEAEVAASGGHSHGGEETSSRERVKEMGHAHGAPADPGPSSSGRAPSGHHHAPSESDSHSKSTAQRQAAH